MNTPEKTMDRILRDLRERAKELSCLYRVDEILSQSERSVDQLMEELVRELPKGWQYPEACHAKIVLGEQVHAPLDLLETEWNLQADITVEGEPVGEVSVFYTSKKPPADLGPFLSEELRLINAIAERIGYHLAQRKLRAAISSWKDAIDRDGAPKRKWHVIVEFLRNADERLMIRITRRMINYLCWGGYPGSETLLHALAPVREASEPSSDDEDEDENRPLAPTRPLEPSELTDRTFRLASAHLTDSEITSCVQRWIREDKTSFLADALENPATSLAEIADALERHRSLAVRSLELPSAVHTSLKVSLLRRFFSDQIEFINMAKDHVEVEDFYDLLRHMIYPPGSHGKLGGKSAGLFLARNALRRVQREDELLADLKVPKTWYVTSDGILEFIRYNNMEDVYVRKYDKIEHVRQSYPYLVQAFKSSPFPSDLTSRLASALDDFGDNPIIVRSSSLLEDRMGSAFSGKYKSLFLANQGTKGDRLAALQDAIAEVYASTFGPDPIGYRAERGLLDVHEEMAIMIQEVVGTRVGRYFFPAYAGVAFSNNEFRWSPRIRRDDGLVRMVPGLGTRAVDRLTDDYPVLISPGQPGLRVNTSPDEVVRYAPRKIDVINVETNRFETVDVTTLIREVGSDYPAIRRVVSLLQGRILEKPLGILPDFREQEFVVTFEGLAQDTPFLERVRSILVHLQKALGVPVDIEFASDGEDFYLLQCRPQSYSEESAPAPIPRDLPPEQVLFTATRYVSNGRVPDITHIVYVDPEHYSKLGTLEDLRAVGVTVRSLNKVLPKRQFILMGPGRWGSRGDIKLGVSVTYSDINNAAVLVEIARKQGNYVPDLSFGTHFFQDLVEAGIRYLPLYPDEEDVVFNESFFRGSRNVLVELLPDRHELTDIVRVIDVPAETNGNILRILMNADLDEAIGVLASPSTDVDAPQGEVPKLAKARPSDHWRWRLRIAQRIAEQLDRIRYGVKEVYLIGSTKNANAGPGSDIDLMIHFEGTESQKRELAVWLDGWSRSLAEINYLRTGYKSKGLLDVHWITDADIAQHDSYASKIDAITDPALPLPLQ